MSERFGVEGIVLAGMQPWGEYPLETFCARPLLPLAGCPLVWYAIDWLRRGGVRLASLCANSTTSAFRQHLGDGSSLGMSLEYYEDQMPRGPAGCMRDAALMNGAQSLVVVDGTIVTNVNLRRLLESHFASGATLTVAVTGRGASDWGPHEAGEPVGVYVVSRTALEHVSATGYQDIKQALIPRLYERGGRVLPYVVKPGESRRVTGPASYLSVTAWVVDGLTRAGKPPEGYMSVGDGWAHASSRLHPSVRVVGPVLIGPGCTIERGVTLVGPTSIDADCRVERDAVISRTTVWSGSRVGARAIVDHSVLADGSDVEPELVMRDTVSVPPDGHDAFHDRSRLYWRLCDGATRVVGDRKVADAGTRRLRDDRSSRRSRSVSSPRRPQLHPLT